MRRLLLAATLLSLAALGAGAVATDLPPALGEAWDALYLSVELAGALACGLRAALVRARRVAWTCMALAGLAWFLGDAAWTYVPGSAGGSWITDALYLSCYPLCAAAFGLLLTGRRDRVTRALWIDGAICGLAIGAVLTALLFEPLFATGPATLEEAVDFAFPLFDVLLLALVVIAFALQSWRPSRGWLLLGAGAALLALVDAVFLYIDAHGAWEDGTPLDLVWPAALLCWGWAAWQPWRAPRAHAALGRPLFVIPTAFSLLALLVLFHGALRDVPLAASVLAMAALLLATARASANYRHKVRLLDASRAEARSDGLTGLPNRRALMTDLDEALAGGAGSAPRTLAFFDLDGFKGYNDAFGHVAGDMLLQRLGAALGVAVGAHGRAYRLAGDEFCVLLDGARADGDPLLAACVEALTAHGDGFAVTCSHGAAVLPAEATSASRALTLADERMYAMKDERTRPTSRRHTADVLMQVLREREPELHDHSDGVTELALVVGRRLGLSAERLDELARAAELHDIGKIAIPGALLHKPGPLDEAEWALMREHTVIGSRILAASPAMRPVAALVRGSHERWDGRGYPDGLAGEAIPLGARVVAVCDSYSAMTGDRPYQPPMGHDAAIAELRRCAGTQFDPAVVAVFCEAFGDEAAVAALGAAQDVPQAERRGASPSAR